MSVISSQWLGYCGQNVKNSIVHIAYRIHPNKRTHPFSRNKHTSNIPRVGSFSYMFHHWSMLMSLLAYLNVSGRGTLGNPIDLCE